MTQKFMVYTLLISFLTLMSCSKDSGRGDFPGPGEGNNDDDGVVVDKFYFGSDLSYVNQILDHGGQYLDEGEVRDPYRIFSDHGSNLARFRLWHNPVWTKEIYGDEGTQLYNDLLDVEKAIQRSKDQGMEVLLDFHYSDNWADPGTQRVPAAWTEITDINVLADSIYNYTHKTLTYLDSKGLMPELVQVGNETNCGMLLSGANDDFPDCDICDENWSNAGAIFNSAIAAIRDVNEDTKVILHVADPVNIEWWFSNMIDAGNVSDFEMIGISYYPLWHTDVPFSQIQDRIEGFITQFEREVVILETAYPWTQEGDDNYNNIFGGDDPLQGYPYTEEGQMDFLTTLTQSLIDAGASGVVYWEPAWISSNMKDQWGTGSSWENNTFFDFEGNTISSIDYMNYEYDSDE